jgi:radical SAM protein with 4Fe4S-binding SPASM domain
VITSVGRRNLDELPAIHGLLKGLGVQTWQVQLAHRTGRAGQEGAPELLEPDELPRLVELLTPMTADPVLQPRIHNSIGYLSVEEPLLRPSGFRRGPRFWPGCRCGVISIGIEPDGGVKGCASQVGAPFVVGRLREEPLRTIWQERERWHWLKPSSLQGECADCALGKVCRAGCTALALSSSGRLFDNPHCLRAVRRRGMEEGP